MALLLEKNAPSQKSGEFESSNFKINASSKAFRILSDGLYSDKILAVVRELSTNAYDAHVAKGNPEEPFSVTLPNVYEPVFKIRDYGIGLSHDDVMSMYTTYFESNKTHSNDYTGCLGLGSKSPFAYTDQFVVASYFEGVKRVYSLHVQRGFPEIACLTTEETTERNGLEITIPVKPNDFYDFNNRAMRLYPYFKTHPTVEGNTNFIPKSVEYKFQGEGWGYRKDAGYSNSKLRAIMGNIAYPVSYFTDLNADEHKLLEAPFDVYFNVGELEITQSRESLSLEPTTRANIKKRLGEIAAELRERMNAEIDSCDCLWDAKVKAYYAAHDRESDLYIIHGLTDKSKLNYKGQQINKMTIDIADFRKNEGNGKLNVDTYYRDRAHRGAGDVNRVRRNVYEFEVHPDVIFYYNDLPRGAGVRCKKLLSEGKYKKVHLIDVNDPTCYDSFLDKIGLPKERILKASSLPKPSYNRSGNGIGASVTGVFSFIRQSRHSVPDYKFWSETEVDLDNDDGVYVEMIRHSVQKGTQTLDPGALSDIMVALEKIGKMPDKLYGFRKNQIKKVEKADNWVSLWDYVNSILKTAEVVDNIGEALGEAEATYKMNNFDCFNNNMFQSQNKKLPATSPFAQFITEFNRMVKARATCNYAAYATLSREIGYQGLIKPPKFDLNAEVDKLKGRYPLLHLLLDNRYYVDERQVTEYLSMVDAVTP